MIPQMLSLLFGKSFRKFQINVWGFFSIFFVCLFFFSKCLLKIGILGPFKCVSGTGWLLCKKNLSSNGYYIYIIMQF